VEFRGVWLGVERAGTSDGYGGIEQGHQMDSVCEICEIY
jgi:hypothetical protein